MLYEATIWAKVETEHEKKPCSPEQYILLTASQFFILFLFKTYLYRVAHSE